MNNPNQFAGSQLFGLKSQGASYVAVPFLMFGIHHWFGFVPQNDKKKKTNDPEPCFHEFPIMVFKSPMDKIVERRNVHFLGFRTRQRATTWLRRTVELYNRLLFTDSIDDLYSIIMYITIIYNNDCTDI